MLKMNDIDIFLAECFEKRIIEKLGIHAIQKIKDRIETKYGMSLTHSIMEFDIFENVLFEFFGSGNEGIISDCIKSVCIVKIDENQIEIKDASLEKSILEVVQDKEQKIIFRKTMKSPMTLKEMVIELQKTLSEEESVLKIKSLISNKILIPLPKENNYETYYSNVMKSMTLNFKDGEFKITLLLKENINQSVILNKILQ